jgi:hypothetical protein
MNYRTFQQRSCWKISLETATTSAVLSLVAPHAPRPGVYQVAWEPKVSIMSRVEMKCAYPPIEGSACLPFVDFIGYWYRTREKGKDEGKVCE